MIPAEKRPICAARRHPTLVSVSHLSDTRLARFAMDKKQISILALCAILLLGAGLRGYGITQRGIFDYDEAWYLLEAKTLYNTGRYALARVGLTEDADASLGLKAYIKQRGTVPLTSIKPGHTVLLFSGLLLFGPHDYAGFLVSMLAGLLTIFLVYRLGREMFGPDVGLLAALFLAVSPFHILYSRAAYAQANGVCLVTLGAYLWYRAHSRDRCASSALIWPGLAIGWAFTCHFNLAWIPIAFALLEAIAVWIQKDRFPTFQAKGKQLAFFGTAMAAPPLLFELAGTAARWMGVFPADYPTYLGQFAHRGPMAKALGFSMEQVPFWTSRLLEIEGLFVLLMASAGLLVTLWRVRRLKLNDLLLLGLFLAAVAPPSLLAVKGLYYILRNYAIAAPALALLSGLGAAWMLRQVESRFGRRLLPITLALCLFIAISGSRRAWDLLQVRSGYREAAGELMQHMSEHGGRLATLPPSAWPIWYFYLSEAYDNAPRELRGRIRFYPKEGDTGDYELLDVKRYFRAVSIKEPHNLVAYSKLRRLATPVVSVTNLASTLPQKYFEGGGERIETARRVLAEQYPESRKIEIYDLRSLKLPVLSSTQ